MLMCRGEEKANIFIDKSGKNIACRFYGIEIDALPHITMQQKVK